MNKNNIRVATPRDCGAIASIYNYYIRDSVATLEELPISADEMALRMTEVTKLGLPWFVAEDPEGISGYAYATPWQNSSGCRFCVESAIYIDPHKTSRGIGTDLYVVLLDELRRRPLQAIVTRMALPSAAGIRLHERLGFEKVAHFKSVAFKFNRRIDVTYWQLSLERAARGM